MRGTLNSNRRRRNALRTFSGRSIFGLARITTFIGRVGRRLDARAGAATEVLLGHNGPIRPILTCGCLWLCLCLGGAPALAGVDHVDGISDQSLPAWDGSFTTSALAGLLRGSLSGGPRPKVTLARYVLQWNAAAEPSKGPSASGNYRERFEAWLADVHTVGLTPVLALTSYDGVYPASSAAYLTSLEQVLGLAIAMNAPIAYLEPWNEPNGQGQESAAKAAQLADTANPICEALDSCLVIAGDLQDTPGMAAYERAYEQALDFRPQAWGVHPYVAVKTHDEATLLSFKANLPAGGDGAQLWFTEVGAYYCRAGTVRGEASQAADAAFLLNTLIADPRLAPAHVLYYSLQFADRRAAPCARGGGDDSELYGPGDAPRAAAGILFPAAIAATGSELFGPAPGYAAGEALWEGTT